MDSKSEEEVVTAQASHVVEETASLLSGVNRFLEVQPPVVTEEKEADV